MSSNASKRTRPTRVSAWRSTSYSSPISRSRRSTVLMMSAAAAGVVTPAEAAERFMLTPAPGLGFARVDHHREARTGMPEVIYAPGKTLEQVRAVAARLLTHSHSPVIATKAGPEVFDAVRD